MVSIASITDKKTSQRNLWLFVAAAVLIAVVSVIALPAKPNALAGFALRQVAILELILFFAGLTSGLSGFGFAAIGAVSLVLLPPVLGIPLLQALSMANQLLSVGQLRKDMPTSLKSFWEGPGPYILGGVFGVPVGVWLLTHLPARQLMIVFGSALILYSLYSIFNVAGNSIRVSGSPAAGSAVGFLGGTFGGFTAFPGAAVVVWTALQGLPKAKNRAIVQPYIIMSQVYALALLAWLHPKTFTRQYWMLFALTIPAVLPGTTAGVLIYRHISDVNFKRVTFFMLGISGAVLLAKVLIR